MESEPDFRFHRAENFRREIKERHDGDDENGKRQHRVVMDERESAENRDILGNGQADIGRRFWRTVGSESGGSFGRVSDETGGTAEQDDEHVDDRRMMSENLKGDQRATDRADDGVNCVPRGVDPGNFVGEKLEQIQNAGDDDDPGLAENFERLVARRERDPMEMDREASNENGEIKIDAGEAGEAERDGDGVESIHGGISDPVHACHVQTCASAATERRDYSAEDLHGRAPAGIPSHARYPAHSRTTRLCEKPAADARWRRRGEDR